MIDHALDERAIFFAALDLPAGPEREIYLHQACRGEPDLLTRVRLLFSLHQQSQGPLDSPPFGLCITAAPDQPAERIGTLIGHYKLLEQIGEGGMGSVYVAEQTEPVRRRVALKIIKPGMDTKQVIARFQAERQALAMMDHPHIAHVLDAGTTDVGRPYFVMELVRGLPITDYCDKAKLTPRQRLALFIDICQAVHHAHQKGIIHRDLKPSNVLATLHYGVPVIKVIDFGVAKAVGQQLTDCTVYTALTQLIGTPLYMSPEQAEMSCLDADTRSDVYSLGVLLYELLTGQTPFDKARMKRAGFDEMRRIIREEEPPRPSHCISALNAQASSTISQQRGLDVRHLGRALRGELDWIVMKALEKDRKHRYESAAALAAEIQRFLDDEPVLACPPTTMYRFHKFAKKHKPALAAAAAIGLCLVLGTAVSAWQAVRAIAAEAQANANEQKAVANEQKANTNAAQALANEQEAIRKRDEAQRQRDEIKSLNERLEATQAELKSTLYAAHMNLAQQAWNADGPKSTMRLLNLYRPKPEESDVRGFEWHYLHRLCEGGQIELNSHTSALTCAAFSKDGKRLVTGSRDLTLKIWDAQSGKLLHTLNGHQTFPRTVAFSDDGSRIVSGAYRGTRADSTGELMIWDPVAGRALQDLMDIIGINAVAISPDNKHVAGGFGEIREWSAETGLEKLRVVATEKETEYVTSLAYAPDGKQIAAGLGNINTFDEQGVRSNGAVKRWEIESGKLLFSATTRHMATCVVFSPNGKRLASSLGSIGGMIFFWDVAPGALPLTHGKDQLATARDPATFLADPVPALILYGRGPGASSVSGIAYGSNGKRLAASYSNKTVLTFDAESGERLTVTPWHTGVAQSVAFSPDGNAQVALANNSSGLIKTWPAVPGRFAYTISDCISNMADFSPDGKRLATATERSIKVWDWRARQELIELKGHTGVIGRKVFTPGGNVLVSTCADKTARVWDLESGKEIAVLRHSVPAQDVAISPDGNALATSALDGKVRLWESKTWRELRTFEHDSIFSPNTGLAFSPDGTKLATAGSDRRVKIWDLKSGDLVLTLSGPRGSCFRISYSPDGSRIVASSNDHFVWIWDATSASVLLKLEGLSGTLNNLAYSPDGKRIASSASKTVLVWDALTGQQVLRFTPGGAAVAFCPDRHYLNKTSCGS